MNQQRDLERILDHWFTDGPTTAADRVFDAVAERIERQPQRPAWRLLWRETHMTTNLKPLTAIAAALVVGVVGLALVGLTSRDGVAAPSTSAAPTATAFACYGDTTGCAGALAAGEHTSTNFLLNLTFTTPDGWVNVRDIRRTYGLETNAGLAAPIEVMGLNAIAEQTDTCGAVRKAGVGSSVQDLTTALKAHPGLVTTDPVAADVDGFKGQSIDFTIASSWVKKCPDIDPINPVVLLLTDTAEPPGRAIGYLPDQRVRWTVIDVNGETVIIELVGPISQFEASVAAAQPVVDSFRFSPGR